MRSFRFQTAWMGVVVLASVSCGSNGGTSLDRSKAISSLTQLEKTELCDQLNGAQGGYGKSTSCPDGSTQTTDPSQASCVAAVPPPGSACAGLTVGQALDCANAVGTTLCSFLTATQCKPVRDCSGAP